MQNNKIRRFSGIAMMFALALSALSLTGCGDKPPEQLGIRTAKIDASDKVLNKQVVAQSAPTAGQANVSVKVTTNYRHDRTFKADQDYTIETGLTAEYVERLQAWMVIDADGAMFRLVAGSVNGTAAQRQTIDIGARQSPIHTTDPRTVSSVAAGPISSDGNTRTLNVTFALKHAEKYNDVSYSVTTPVDAERVQLQNAYMAWVGDQLYRVDAGGRVERLSEKPTAYVNNRQTAFASTDTPIGDATVSTNPNQLNRLIVSRDYIHEEKYQKIRYSLQSVVEGTWVPEQEAWMAYVEKDLYKVSRRDGGIQKLQSKPVSDIGARFNKLDIDDQVTATEVVPERLTIDRQSIEVSVRRIYTHEQRFQVVKYFTEQKATANYDPNYKLHALSADGKTFVIAFPGDQVNDRNVTVVQAPSSLARPITPNAPAQTTPNPTKGGPPVVVPGGQKSTPNTGGPPVVTPR